MSEEKTETEIEMEAEAKMEIETDKMAKEQTETEIEIEEQVEMEAEGHAEIEWAEEYDELMRNPPKAGDILRSIDDSKVVLSVSINKGSPPFIYGCAFVPEVVGSKLGWFLQSVDGESFHGFKCILMPRARADLVRRVGLSSEVVEVTSLRVIRESQSKKSLLCEIEKF